VTSLDVPQFAAGYALAAVPARHALERRAWEGSFGADGTGDVPLGEVSLREGDRSLRPRSWRGPCGRPGSRPPGPGGAGRDPGLASRPEGVRLATQVEIQRRAAAAWVARAEKKDAEAVALMRSAADLEDSTDKHPVTPGSILPAREQLADLLAELGQPAAALAEYETSLRSAPARLNSYDGAARAAERAGKKREAKVFHERLVALCGDRCPPGPVGK